MRVLACAVLVACFTLPHPAVAQSSKGEGPFLTVRPHAYGLGINSDQYGRIVKDE